MGFPGASAGKESACSAGDLRSIPGLGRSPGGGKDYLLQYSGLENSMDCIVHGVAKSLAGYRLWGNKELDTTEYTEMNMLFILQVKKWESKYQRRHNCQEAELGSPFMAH